MKKLLFLYKDELYIYHKKSVIKGEFKKQRGIVTTIFPYDKVYSLNFNLPKTISKENLEIEAEKYVFSDGSLDFNKEYKIVYKFQELNDSYLVDAFIVDVEEEREYFKDYLKMFKYIDFATISPFVFESFYEFNNPKTDIFIYLDENDAFLSCFRNGEFLFVKSLNKLSILANSLNLKSDRLKEMLESKGLDKEKYSEEIEYNYVDNFFSEFFMKVNNIIAHSLTFYQLDKIERIYFYSPFKIKNLLEVYKEYFEYSNISFRRYEINSEIDPFVYSAILYIVNHIEEDSLNISAFKRPLPFYKTKTGQLGMFIFVIVALLGGDLAYKYKVVEDKKVLLKELKERYKLREKIANELDKKIKTQISINEKIKEEIASLQKEIDTINVKLSFLYSILKKPLFSNELNKIIYAVYRLNLELISLEKNENEFVLMVGSKERESYYIGVLMQELIKLGFKDVSSAFVKSQKNSLYISQVSFKDE